MILDTASELFESSRPTLELEVIDVCRARAQAELAQEAAEPKGILGIGWRSLFYLVRCARDKSVERHHCTRLRIQVARTCRTALACRGRAPVDGLCEGHCAETLWNKAIVVGIRSRRFLPRMRWMSRFWQRTRRSPLRSDGACCRRRLGLGAASADDNFGNVAGVNLRHVRLRRLT